MQLLTPDLSAALFPQQLFYFPQFLLQLLHPRQIQLPLLLQHAQQGFLVLGDTGVVSIIMHKKITGSGRNEVSRQ